MQTVPESMQVLLPGLQHANGAKASAVLYSIAATAQANGVDTERYLTELFSQPVGTISLPFNT